MNELQIFNHEKFGEVRTVVINGDARFVGVDVTRGLEYANPSKAITDHCKGGYLNWKVIDGKGREQETRLITLGDVCRLIVKAATQSQSKTVQEKADEYESWIFDEVLPAIHRTGGYSIKGNEIPLLTAATGYIREMRRLMKEQGSTARKIAEMAYVVCLRYDLPLPKDFIEQESYEQLRLTFNIPKEVEVSAVS